MGKIKLFRRLQACKCIGVFAIIAVWPGGGQFFRMQAGDGLSECKSYR
jgi:hypothetical protein